ncbi:hypothetical protein NE857_06260 [Nocardiopsis exhalans]|uniref:Uncharacterized protein n=1 Tax=Nocardiopsis exhalans TaxID=163604 RepID=A0ABY5DB87_9ACTN|nr:hypothetical protein [Nocardiopsis exhalans]USY21225.1 hypothetical protein NE857_06260 [Nocardiopsis exhalans]
MTPGRRPDVTLPGPVAGQAPLSAVDVIGRAIIEPRRRSGPGDPVALVQRVLWEALDPPDPGDPPVGSGP